MTLGYDVRTIKINKQRPRLGNVLYYEWKINNWF